MKIEVRINKRVFNRAFWPLIDCKTRYLVIYGGAGSGKSYFVGQRYIKRMLQQKCNLLVVRNTAKSNRDSTFALLCQVISKWNLDNMFKIQKGDLRIKCINGNEIIFAGLDDVEKLKSITFSKGELTDIWVEEASEILESDFNQLDVRLRGRYGNKQIVVTFNPIDINHWLKHRFVDVKSEDITVHHSTYLDNDFLDDHYGKVLESYKTLDPYYYDVYCLGNWGVLGKTVFDARAIKERMKNLQKPLKVGFFDYKKIFTDDGPKITGIKWVNDPNGYIKLYQVPDSPRITEYAIGGDTAGEGSDWFIGQVVDARDGTQVAVLRHQFDADQYADQMYCLGKFYKTALIGIEKNYDTHPLKVLEQYRYPNLYVTETEDTYTGKPKKSHGFKTDAISRPRIISRLVQIVREHVEIFNDKETLEEMLTFVRNEKGRAEAQAGAHDDLVMAMAIAQDIKDQVVIKEEAIRPGYYPAFSSFGARNHSSDDEIEVI